MANDPKQNVLVTGGGGFLGSAIVKMLHERGDQVTSFSRGFYPELESMGVKQVQGDLCEYKSVSNACREADVVFHVAAKPGVWGKYSDFYNTNVTGTVNIVNACLEHEVPRLVHTSSPSVVFNGSDMEGVNESVPYPDYFHSHYSKTKAIAEQYVIKSTSDKLKTIILRPHLIWGPKDNHLVPRIISRAKRLVRIGSRDNLVDTVYISNAAHAHILAADKLVEKPGLSGNIYFVSQDEPICVWDMINDILGAAGLDPINKSMPHGLVRLIAAILELVYMTFKIKEEPPLTRFVVDELASSHWFDISAIKNDLGYTPLVSINEGLKELENWLRNN
ncbi:MAG: NAD-dependent epimerase/dehydratase family protein [Desulfobacterales bacterium]|mgnify:CR=1 FL=1|jgi:2-alkyl-3-oxoalkanoate reductase|nr:NAD-dependent epimerase/dehydratase family protein [Desulfobacteraceae bacterium]MBT7085992.1 NAD-dependent epimerase/dehydratase family protein [Desulfobacterales bacterium]MBT7698392.1 NAD-dependent epimerase/dehydratase family protein [Desulfobacterales bacterium]